jgi:hypothetical protein
LPSYELISTLVELRIIFSGDRSIADAPATEELGEKFASEFAFSSLSLLADPNTNKVTGWNAVKGRIKNGDDLISIEACEGNRRQLAITASDVDDARLMRALKTIWGALHGLAKSHGPMRKFEELDRIGTFLHNTVAIVRLSEPFPHIFPFYDRLRDSVSKRLSQSKTKPLEHVQYRQHIEIQLPVGGLRAGKRIAFEPRVGTAPDERVFWTESPLSSTEHLAWLEEICSALRS